MNMMSTLALCLLSAFSLNFVADNPTAVQKEPKGVYFFSEKGRFKVKLPSKPTYVQDEITIGSEQYPKDIYLCEVDEQLAFIVAYSDYPQEEIDRLGAEKVLQRAKEAACSAYLIQKPEESKEWNFKKHPGIYFKGNNGAFYTEYRLLLVGNRLYQIGLMRSDEYPDGKTSKRFMRSFKLLKT